MVRRISMFSFFLGNMNSDYSFTYLNIKHKVKKTNANAVLLLDLMVCIDLLHIKI